MLGRGDQNRVDRRIVEQMAIVGIGCRAGSEFGGIREAAGPDVRERREFDAGACGGFARKLGATIASADDTDPKTVIRAPNPTCRGEGLEGKARATLPMKYLLVCTGPLCDFTACHKPRPGGV